MDGQNKTVGGFLDDEMIKNLLLVNETTEKPISPCETSTPGLSEPSTHGVQPIHETGSVSEGTTNKHVEGNPCKDTTSTETFEDEEMDMLSIEDPMEDIFDSTAIDQVNDLEIGNDLVMQMDENLPSTDNVQSNVTQTSMETQSKNKTNSETRNDDSQNSTDDQLFEFFCPECRKGFVHEILLKKHVEKHHPSLRPFLCNLCQKSFPSNAGLKQHLATHDKSKLYTCFVCFASYKQKGSLTTHQKQCPGAMSVERNSSESTQSQRSDSVSEATSTSFKTGDYSDVFQQFLSQPKSASEKDHLSAGKPFTCPICGGSYKGKHHLNSHMLRHSEDSPYKCQYCQKVFSSIYEVRRHLFTHTKEYAAKCQICERLFADKSELNRHMVKNHTREYPLRCDLCQKGFVQSHELRKHMRTHETHERKLECELCHKIFSNYRGLSMHIKMGHREARDLELDSLKTVPCSEAGCDKFFMTMEGMLEHVQIVHLRNFPIKCDLCNQGFARKDKLVIHMESKHPSESQKLERTCQICGKIAKSKKYLIIHMRKHREKSDTGESIDL